MATLRFENVNKIYDNNVQAVFDFNLEVKDKEFIVFVGPSGCGKSTTLRMVAGLEDITYGDLYIDDVLVNEVLPKDRDIAMVFQNYALFPHMTVYGNMEFSLKMRKIPLPVYEESEEAEALYQENLLLLKQIKKINAGMKKQIEGDDVLQKRAGLYEQVYANEEKRKSILVQTVGIYKEKIVLLNKSLKKLQKDIVNIKKDIKDIGDNDESGMLKTLTAVLERKEKQVNELTTQIEYLTNNEVPLYKTRKLTKYEIDLEVNQSAAKLDLTRYLFRKPAALSGGQRQRVALGRAIVRQPKVFLMDEPLSNLDAKLRVQTRSEISKIHETVGATTIYVTHDQVEAMTMADRIVVMKDGYVQQIGKPSEVYDDPNNIFVAGFIGSPAMNFLKGTFNGKVFVIDGENDLKVEINETDRVLLERYVNKSLVLGVRPEYCYTYKVKDAKTTTSLKANCYLSELLGSEIIAYTELNGQKIAVKTNEKHPVRTHDDFDIYFDSDKLYFFEAESTLRIRQKNNDEIEGEKHEKI